MQSNLVVNVEEILKQHSEKTELEQSEQIAHAVQLVDSLLKKGLAELPQYRLAPAAVSSRAMSRC